MKLKILINSRTWQQAGKKYLGYDLSGNLRHTAVSYLSNDCHVTENPEVLL